MIKKIVLLGALLVGGYSFAQEALTIEKLWQIKRISPIGLSDNKTEIIYSVTTPDVEKNSFERTYYKCPIVGGASVEISAETAQKLQQKVSKDGKWVLIDKPVRIENVLAPEIYADLKKSSGKLYTNLDYRHWDKWSDGTYRHVFLQSVANPSQEIDLLEGLPYYCPQEPFGGSEDYIWHPSGSKVLYVTKAKRRTDYVVSTNTDIYEYDLQTKQTKNLTEGMMGYDRNPAFSSQGVLAWLSMATDGNEADKNDLYIDYKGKKINLTKDFDLTIESFMWNDSGNSIYCIIATQGTTQLFELFPFNKNKVAIKQLTRGKYDISSIVGQSGDKLLVTKMDMNHASDIYTYSIKSGQLMQLTKENDALYTTIKKCRVEERYVTTTDNKKMLTWVIYPPDFDPSKKYPTLLYCQGGPQSPLSQFYSFRWNFQLMASNGYIVVAPNRRGMPGFGVEWNAQISGDWGGQVMRDYLSAVDDIKKESYVDANRIGAVGASYGGYSVFYLAGIHQNRFKTFITHCGVFDLRSMYGTTEEKFFNNNEQGGAYWKKNATAVRSYSEFNPINFVNNWTTPILIIQGGKDYRVPKEQAFQAFTAAQLKGIKSELLFFPDENHWILQPQNGIFWQRTFYRWLKETL
ncbi:S9 family peptidase [Capnocytophaga catalasegens]|uniref:Peptidase S9 n=1 Tax=Capnocytophaga catalasegens TaxID=1004260 RepID=A0AAV5ATV8_9FLAO|nr:S9 family peptidase [Capnocytophaga catalasegens]GIZ15935.1 peptidase S9 [Capnocytophaga catalasegens]GJM49999.1 peptidase S9 [Capnocytophaga catalasegens]GJM54109.1 peptidase S9 [Capnocytophaga catalasegens]